MLISANASLLSRLDRGGPRNEISSRPSLSEVERSILDNLQRLFQIRQGNCLSAPRCGVPDLTAAFRSESDPTRSLCDSIESMIREFEPRLRRVRVRRIDGDAPGQPRFEIRATIDLEDGKTPFRAQTVMTNVDRLAIEN